MIHVPPGHDVERSDEPRVLLVPDLVIKRASERLHLTSHDRTPESIEERFELMRASAKRVAEQELPHDRQRALRRIRMAQIIDDSVGGDPVAARCEVAAPAWTVRNIVANLARLFSRTPAEETSPRDDKRPPVDHRPDKSSSVRA